MNRITAWGLAGLTAASVAAAGLALPAHAVDKKEFKVVGTWGNLAQLERAREPLLERGACPEASGGKLTANAKPYTELGLKGYEVMRLLKIGAYDAVHGLTSYTSAGLASA